MTLQPSATVDDLLELVAGTLDPESFHRVATAVKNDITLQGQLASFEKIRSELIHNMNFDKREVTASIFAEHMLKRVALPSTAQADTKTSQTWIRQLQSFFVGSPTPARFAYGLVAIQAVGMVWLVSGGLQTYDVPAASTRTVGADSKQLGAIPSNVTFSISFDPATPESTVRGLLLELEAQIIAGPSQLGQYKIVVARSRSHLALLKLREAVFVEQVTEIYKDSGVDKDGEKK